MEWWQISFWVIGGTLVFGVVSFACWMLCSMYLAHRAWKRWQRRERLRIKGPWDSVIHLYDKNGFEIYLTSNVEGD